MMQPIFKKEKNKGGRPLKYPDENIIVQKAEEYLRTTGREQTSLPTIEGLALYLGMDDEEVSIYSKRYQKFSATVKRIFAKQKLQLMEDGMYGGKEVNSSMAIFLLKANHGMIETEKKILSGDKDSPLKVNITDYGTDSIPTTGKTK